MLPDTWEKVLLKGGPGGRAGKKSAGRSGNAGQSSALLSQEVPLKEKDQELKRSGGKDEGKDDPEGRRRIPPGRISRPAVIPEGSKQTKNRTDTSDSRVTVVETRMSGG